MSGRRRLRLVKQFALDWTTWVCRRPPAGEKIKHPYWLRSELDTTCAVRSRKLSQYNEATVLVLEDPGWESLHRLRS
jgi:hypothetical protein